MNPLSRILITILCLALQANALAQEAGKGDSRALTLDELRTFTDVFNQIRSHYVDELGERELLRAAIEGMMGQLDPWSDFMGADEFRQFSDSSEGRYGGIGVRAEVRNQRIHFTAVTPGGPASAKGILAGDLLLAVDGIPVRGRRLSESMDALLGEPGSRVNLKLQTPGQAAREVEVTRDYLAVPSVFRKTLDGDIGVFMISHFTRHTHEELREGLAELESDSGRPLTGIILDLRGNPGGVVESAVDIADGFLDEGLIVYTRSRYEPTRIEISAERGQWTNSLPLAILVNGGTASAAEVLTGALQDNHRATVIGTKTFGKGSIQSVLALRNGAGMKLTTARYFTPSGRVIQDHGIEPDTIIEAEPGPDEEGTERDPGMAEAINALRAAAG